LMLGAIATNYKKHIGIRAILEQSDSISKEKSKEYPWVFIANDMSQEAKDIEKRIEDFRANELRIETILRAVLDFRKRYSPKE
jgi:hypothetical protein